MLSDPERRQVYDETGNVGDAAAELPKMDPSVFFSVLFGSHHFEPYVGKLQLALFAEAEQEMQEVLRRSFLYQVKTERPNWTKMEKKRLTPPPPVERV